MARLFFYLGVLLGSCISLTTEAQTDEFGQDIKKLLEVNGSTATYDVMYEQLTTQFKMLKPDAPDEVWQQVRTEVFDKEMELLVKQLVPVYKKHFTHEDVKDLIKFYESPLGKRLIDGTGKVTVESMQLAQAWGMGLGQKVTSFLAEQGH